MPRHVQVHQLDDEQVQRAWPQIIGRCPNFDDYHRKTDRQIPVLQLTPIP